MSFQVDRKDLEKVLKNAQKLVIRDFFIFEGIELPTDKKFKDLIDEMFHESDAAGQHFLNIQNRKRLQEQINKIDKQITLYTT